MITPDSEIRLLAGVPLDPTYQHTIYWDSADVQRRDMGNFSIGTFGKQYYQRVSKNTLRLKSNIAGVYQANYMMFKNAGTVPGVIPGTTEPGQVPYTGYPDKWFYAFVLNVEYVNEQVVEITYDIDVIQTWFFEIKDSLKPCFIERQHTTTDEIGDHRIPEPVGAPDFLYQEVFPTSGGSAVFTTENMKPNIIICSTFKKNSQGEWDFSPGGMQGGMYTGINVNVFAGADEANAFIENATDDMKSEGIVSVYMLPKLFCPKPATGTALDVVRYQNCKIPKYISPWNTNPKNNKLYTAPYYTLYVVANDGRSAEFLLEDFLGTDKDNCMFDIISVPSAKPEIALLPKNYKLKPSESGDYSYNDIFIINDIPYCAFAIDSYKAWLAQNKIRIGGELLTTAIGAGATLGMAAIPGLNAVAGTMMAAGTASSTIKSGISMFSDILTATKMPPHLSGQQTSSIMMATESLKFRFYYAYVQDDYMKIIDDFFTVYGYAIKKVAVPNLKARSNWTYIKTNGFNIRTQKGEDADAGTSIPAQDILKIKNIFDNGVTFWTQASYVGNYDADNLVIT